MTQTSRPAKSYPFNLLILLTLVAILASIWYASHYLKSRSTADMDWFEAQDCDLPAESCLAQLQIDKSMRFELLTDDPQPLQPLPVRVTLSGFSEDELAALRLELDLQGRDMYMGYNRVPMVHQGGGVFTATPTLSLCVDQQMVWRSSVLIAADGQARRFGSYFDFNVIQHTRH